MYETHLFMFFILNQ